MDNFNIHNLFSELASDNINNGSRLVLTKSGIQFSFLINLNESRRETCIQVAKRQVKSTYPCCNGIELETTKQLFRGNKRIEGEFIILKQVPDFDPDGKKYETIINDIFSSLYSTPIEQANKIVKEVLAGWQKFFTKYSDKNPPSENEQQGLFGELLFLKKLISQFGTKAVNFWQGPFLLPHDFSLSETDAIEVKTSSKAAPYAVEISNEYQLDSEGNGQLFLAFYALERNEIEGKSVPDLVAIIESYLESDFIQLNSFTEKLAKAKYHKSFAEQVNLRFKQRENLMLYHVTEDFPKISRKKQNISTSIGNIKYTLALGELDKYLISDEEFIQKIKRLL